MWPRALLLGACALVASAPLAAQSLAADGETAVTTLVLPDRDVRLQAALERSMQAEPFRSLIRRGRLSVALVDLSEPGALRYAAIDDDRMRYAASLPKIAIMLGVFDQVEQGELEYTPELRGKMERMIRNSDNRISSELIRLVGFENIAASLRDPHHELYDIDRQGGLWVGRGYGGLGVWRRDPLANLSHGATARQVARFLVMMEQGTLVSPWASREMKSIMGDPAIEHKFVLGLRRQYPLSRIFRKSGTWRDWHADAAVVERAGKKYIAVALAETSQSNVLSRLIVRLDDLVTGPQRPRRIE